MFEDSLLTNCSVCSCSKQSKGRKDVAAVSYLIIPKEVLLQQVDSFFYSNLIEQKW